LSSGKSFNHNLDEIKKQERSSSFNLGEYLAEISNGFISFAKFSKRMYLTDIYSGNEEIPFEERDPRFKAILMQELLANSKKSLKIRTNFKNF